MNDLSWDTLIVGAGIYGMCAAYHADRIAPGGRICVLDQLPTGHSRGSSHGETRITRTTYDRPVYVDLARRAHRVDWPELEAEVGQRLIVRSGGLFGGEPGGGWDDFQRTMSSRPEVTPLSPEESTRRFPQFRPRPTNTGFFDPTAGAILASRTMIALRDLCLDRGVTLRVPERVQAIETSSSGVLVRTDAGCHRADRVVIAAGAWIRELVTQLRNRTRIARQTVVYVRFRDRPEAFCVPALPVWVHVGRDPQRFFYGIGELTPGAGVKIARHDTRGPDVDPDRPQEPDPKEIAEVKQFAAEHFSSPIDEVVRVDCCLYTMSDHEDFWIGPHPDDDRIIVAAGFSGHGFKFAPLLGRVVAELALLGATSVPEFQRHASIFDLNRKPPTTIV